jgi:periplasmic protein TonB
MRSASVMLSVGLLVLGGSLGAAQERPGKGVTMPEVLSEVKPRYTDSAKAERIEGNVMLEAVVKEDGSVGDVKVVKSLDEKHGLDAEAIKALKQWRFKPGMKDGKAVAVLVEVEMTFTLK